MLKELADWCQRAAAARGPWGAGRPIAVLALLAAPMLVPWRTTVVVPVVYEGGDAHELFAPEAALVEHVTIKDGDRVRKGETVLALKSPELLMSLARLEAKAAALDRVLDQTLTGEDLLSLQAVRERELLRIRAEISGIKARLRTLALAAPAEGRVTFMEAGLKPGLWVREDRSLLQIVGTRPARATGYVEERDLALISTGASGVIVFEAMPELAVPVEVETLYQEAVKVLDEPMLATSFQGSIPVRTGERRELIPEIAVYKVLLRVDQRRSESVPRRKLRGFAILNSPARSLARRLLDRCIGLWRREFG